MISLVYKPPGAKFIFTNQTIYKTETQLVNLTAIVLIGDTMKPTKMARRERNEP